VKDPVSRAEKMTLNYQKKYGMGKPQGYPVPYFFKY